MESLHYFSLSNDEATQWGACMERRKGTVLVLEKSLGEIHLFKPPTCLTMASRTLKFYRVDLRAYGGEFLGFD